MLVYGGYQFPFEGHYSRDDDAYYSGDGVGMGSGGGGSGEAVSAIVEVLRYHFASQLWETLMTFPSLENITSEDGKDTLTRERQPEPRYGHTSVIYNVSGHFSLIQCGVIVLYCVILPSSFFVL